MSDKASILHHATNAAVVQLPGRAFPGVVTQGDTLLSLLAALAEVRRTLHEGDMNAAKAWIQFVEDRLGPQLRVYLSCADSLEAKLPFDRRQAEAILEALEARSD